MSHEGEDSPNAVTLFFTATMLAGSVHEQVFKKSPAEECFRPWWETLVDGVLATMIGLGKFVDS